MKIRDDQMAEIATAKTRADVSRILGSPLAETAYGTQKWFYAFARGEQFAFMTPTFAEYTILAVEFDAKGNVIAHETRDISGRTFKQSRGETQILTDIKPGFFEELFGNVGRFSLGGMGVDTQSTSGGE